MVRCFNKICKKGDRELNADKSKVMLLGGVQGSVSEVSGYDTQL